MNFQLISAPRLHAPPRFSARLKATRRFFYPFTSATRLAATLRDATRRISLQLNAT